METKNQAFVRLAEKRVNKTLDCYRVISNLFKTNYKSTPDQRDAVIVALRHGLNELEASAAGDKINKEAFKMDALEAEESQPGV